MSDRNLKIYVSCETRGGLCVHIAEMEAERDELNAKGAE